MMLIQKSMRIKYWKFLNLSGENLWFFKEIKHDFDLTDMIDICSPFTIYMDTFDIMWLERFLKKYSSFKPSVNAVPTGTIFQIKLDGSYIQYKVPLDVEINENDIFWVFNLAIQNNERNEHKRRRNK